MWSSLGMVPCIILLGHAADFRLSRIGLNSFRAPATGFGRFIVATAPGPGLELSQTHARAQAGLRVRQRAEFFERRHQVLWVVPAHGSSVAVGQERDERFIEHRFEL